MQQSNTLAPSINLKPIMIVSPFGVAAVIAIMLWLDLQYGSQAGLLWLALTALLGGIGIDLWRRHKQQFAAVCSATPQVRPLQISCLAAEGVGALLLRGTDSTLGAAFPLLMQPWIPAVLIIGGVLGLGVLSLFCDCRNAEFERQ